MEPSPRSPGRSLYRRPLFADAADHAHPLDAAGLEQRLPHRAPMRLVDALVALDAAGGRALGVRHVAADDPVLAGHFPGDPIYPGVLQLELMGQVGLCLLDGELRPRVVGIEQARFLSALRPGDDARVHAAVLDVDPLRGRIAGQVWADDRLCSAAILEVYLG